jgi:uncharacterized membrane protein
VSDYQSPPPPPVSSAQSGLSDSAASGLAYVTIIPAIVFLVVEPYNRNPMVRFHSWQSIFLAIAYIVVRVGFIFLSMLPFFGFMLFPVRMLIGLGFFILWLIVMIKAFNGERFKIPVVGDFAEKQANG